MDVNDLTVGQARRLASMFGAHTVDTNEPHWQVGKAYFIRTVTHHYCGRLVRVTPTELVLVDAAWVAEDGRFSEMLRTGICSEVEPYPDGAEVIVSRGALCDAVLWPHALLRVVK